MIIRKWIFYLMVAAFVLNIADRTYEYFVWTRPMHQCETLAKLDGYATCHIHGVKVTVIQNESVYDG
jgi:hypothetical protein